MPGLRPFGYVFRAFGRDRTPGENPIARAETSPGSSRKRCSRRESPRAATLPTACGAGSLPRRGKPTRRPSASKNVSKQKSEDVLSGYIGAADLMRDPALLYIK